MYEQFAIKHDERAAWLEERRTGIGGSDAAAILGLNPYKSAFSLYMDKLGFLPEQEDNEAMRQGRDFENYVAARFTEKSGKKVRRVNRMLRDKQYDFMIANIDRDIVGEASGLECKTTSVLNLKKFKNGEFPEQYYPQCVHYMSVTGYTRWYLAVLVLNASFMIYQMSRLNNDTIPEWCAGGVYVGPAEFEALIAAEADFWQLVETCTPPAIDGSDSTRLALEAVNPKRDNELIAALYGDEELLDRRADLKVQEKELKSQIAAIDNQIISHLEGAEYGIADGYEISYRMVRKAAYTVKSQEYRQLRIREASKCPA